MVPTCRPCALNCTRRGLHSLAIGLQLGTEGSRPMVLDPWKMHRWVPTRGPGVLTHTRRGPPPGGRAHSTAHTMVPTRIHGPSTAHAVVPTNGLCALNSHEGRPHSRASRSKLGTERSPLVGHGPSNGHGGVPTPGRAPSTAHTVVPTCGPCTLNRARRGPHSRATRLQAHTERSPLAGRGPSTGHGGVRTRGACALGNAQTGPYSRARRPHPHTEGSPP